jgi:hypothetical protein
MKVLYRISDCGNIKSKPDYVNNKKLMFLHFLKTFKNNDIYVFADNTSDELYNYLTENFNNEKLFKISLGNSRSFMHCLDFAIENFDHNEIIYLAEDDYVYTKKAAQIIEEGLIIADYTTGYDHPDKYMNYPESGPNPFIQNGGETTKVLITNNSHWKITNSTTMTFAASVDTLIQDYDIFKRNCLASGPDDFKLFCDLAQIKNRKLISSIPSVSTHGETLWLAKLVNWEQEFYNSFSDKEAK